MRKIDASSKVPDRMRLRACAEARSVPNGFSTMTRAPLAQPDLPSCSHDLPEEHRAGWPGSAPGRLRGAQLFAERLEGRRRRCSRRRRSAAGRTACRRPPDRGRRASRGCLARARLKLVEVPAGLGHPDDRHVEARRVSPWPAATGRSSCRPGRPWRRRRPARRNGNVHDLPPHFAGFFHDARRTGSAWPTAACPGSPPRRAS